MGKKNGQKVSWRKSQVCQKSTINNIENGKTTNPSIEVAFRLADALGVDVRELFTDRGCKHGGGSRVKAEELKQRIKKKWTPWGMEIIISCAR